ncbi:hypothetical protein TVAG_204110 [Trichomonas vaginalis G3]|uniref:Uncharacterized protein n=1 Tax=Trichomonas vaginalis (strain ATCC PRA-98 / G3) TaxID=412133 RepID=A2FXU1_TRIV3|nr:hypothetical protein TVAGG3_0691980 [Trichomonas vaginalis G3]EAX90276.1 hypothetical protein TVAG_204110 [Trichomonas vaginalis G3]KAI5508639.1 hypothetical protein TVAGG3_0691980 [Trichomonas vaginalis G3]|eukprot:XP_001303206.1 hypothetical protein [Trichomonas vaginalis G3]
MLNDSSFFDLDSFSKSTDPIYNTVSVSDILQTTYPDALSFKILSIDEPISYLFLIRFKHGQKIVELSKDLKNLKPLCSFQRYSVVIAASINSAHDKIIVTMFQSSNTFTESSNYAIKCILLNTNPQIVYPISNILTSRPIVEWIPNSNRFVIFTNENRYEIWELNCSKNEFEINRVSKSEKGITWVGLLNKNVLEYTKNNKDGHILTSVIDSSNNTKTNLPPVTATEFFYSHLSVLTHDVFFINYLQHLMIALPAVGLSLDFIFRAGKMDIFDVAAIRNDILIINTPPKYFLCILLDSYCQPRAVFTISQRRDVQLSFIESSNYTVVDIKTGQISTIEFDFEEIKKNQPEAFLPLMHDKVLSCENSFDVLSLIDMNILKLFWFGEIIEEFILCHIRKCFKLAKNFSLYDFLNSRLTTLVPSRHYIEMLSYFLPYQSKMVDELKSPPQIMNWKKAFQKLPELSDLKGVISAAIESVSPVHFKEDVRYIAMLQVLTVYFRVGEEFKASNTMKKETMKNLSENEKEIWLAKGIIIFNEMDLKDKEQETCQWWILRTTFDVEEIIDKDAEFKTNNILKYMLDTYDCQDL